MTAWFDMGMNKWLTTLDMLIICCNTKPSQATKGHQVSPSVSNPFAIGSRFEEKASQNETCFCETCPCQSETLFWTLMAVSFKNRCSQSYASIHYVLCILFTHTNWLYVRSSDVLIPYPAHPGPSHSIITKNPIPIINSTVLLNKFWNESPGSLLVKIINTNPLVVLLRKQWCFVGKGISPHFQHLAGKQLCYSSQLLEWCRFKNVLGFLRNLTALQASFSGLHVSKLSTQLFPARGGMHRWQLRASP